METKFNFNSAVCTSIEQSRKLLALGLKKETADCCYYYYDGEYLIAFAEDAKYPSDIPAWSLHRLIEMCPYVIRSLPSLYLTMSSDSVFYCTEDNNEEYEKPFSRFTNMYDNYIECIEWLIKEGYFNKEYLV